MKTKLFLLAIIFTFCFGATNADLHHEKATRYTCIVCHESRILPNGKVQIKNAKNCTDCHIVNCGQVK